MALKWEVVKSEMMEKGIFAPNAPYTMRARVLGGRFVQVSAGAAGSAFFYPDPEHVWDGSSLP